MINIFQNQFKPSLKTTSIQFNQAELDNLITARISAYNATLESKERIHAQILPELITKVAALLEEGWSFADLRAPYSSTVGNSYIYLCKSPEVQASDCQLIKEKMTELYKEQVAANYEAEKARLIQQAVLDAKQKAAEQEAKKQQDQMKKLEEAAIKAIEEKMSAE
ncbi:MULTISPECIES: hypothetical protein [Pseudomonas]|uniref:hypothetical protein n=1 Tax=Pseudomonas TaxID=286 RepID=UPI000912DBAF|nr:MULTISPECIES: hypothetical protein [Pseudomonas]SHI35659.1 hypothetical protein SAMN05216295_101361 [Pseudomonas zeshuii]